VVVVYCVVVVISQQFSYVRVCVCVVFGPVSAIGDIHGVDTLNYTKDEKVIRGKIASCYRLADINGWSHGLDSYITVGCFLSFLSVV